MSVSKTFHFLQSCYLIEGALKKPNNIIQVFFLIKNAV